MGPSSASTCSERRPDRAGIAYVGTHRQRSAAVLLHESHRVGQIVLGPCKHGNVGTLTGQGFGGGQTDSRGRSGYQRDSVRHLIHANHGAFPPIVRQRTVCHTFSSSIVRMHKAGLPVCANSFSRSRCDARIISPQQPSDLECD